MKKPDAKEVSAAICEKCKEVVIKEGVLVNGKLHCCICGKVIAESTEGDCVCKTIYMADNG